MGPINARVETADSKPTFRDAWRINRCAVPADGWYEWRLENGKKQPYFFRRRDGEPVFFAGLWSGSTFCILTTAADDDLTQIHDRRPLALRTDDAKPWIESMPTSPHEWVAKRIPAGEIAFHPVSTRVSYAKNDGADLIEEVKVPQGTPPELDLFSNPI
jgi:putative SOS response-associated peptidase YedK